MPRNWDIETVLGVLAFLLIGCQQTSSSLPTDPQPAPSGGSQTSPPIGDSSDNTAPVVTAFSMPTSSTALAVPITALVATDARGVTGYLVTETAASPAPGAAGWKSAPPTLFSFSEYGTKTAYAWARDAAGNISTSRSATVQLTEPGNWAGPENVLVLYNKNWADGDGNGKSDSQDIAEYYAAARGVPAENLLGVQCSTGYSITYPDFHSQILTPLVARLNETVEGELLRQKIYYIVTTHGIPVTLNTYFATAEHPFWPGGSYAHNTRSLDQWLMNPFRHLANGYSAENKPRNDDGTTLLGDSSSEIYNSYYGSFSNSVTPTLAAVLPKTFFKKRTATGINFLVTRLDGATPLIAKSLVDKAKYAETYLKYQSEASHPFKPVALVDSDKGRSHGHEGHAGNLVQLLQGLISSVFSSSNSAQELYIGSPFEVISDWVGPGFGLEVGESGHLPEVGATIASVNTAASTITVNSSERVDFFVIGKPITSSGGGTAVITGVNVATKTLTLSNVTNFSATNTVSQIYGGTLPISLHWIYTFYSYGAYRDVYQFKVGALGRHMDSGSCASIRSSSSGTWCAKSLIRNITSVSGAVSEPASSGEAYMDYVMSALSLGANAADAWYNGLLYGNRWMALVISDPLYAPFRNWSAKINDTVQPVIGTVQSAAGGAGQRKIRAVLGGASPEELLDVAQFKIEYGPTLDYGQVVDYEDFSGTIDGLWNNSRRYFFAREFDWILSGLATGTTYHFRVSARDPYGNETVSPDYSFTMP